MRQYLLLGFLVAGCAGTKATTLPPQAAPTATPAAIPTRTLPTKVTSSTEQQVLAVVPPAPVECNAYREHSVGATSECAERGSAVALLDKALSESDGITRDAALAQLTGCQGFDRGLVLALRAEFAQAACGDALIGDFAETNKSKLYPAIYDTLAALKLAAELSRLVRTAPQVDEPHTKERLSAFIKGVMSTWALEQANAISALSLKGARLSGYGKGLVAVTAGMADMRFVEVFRQVPIPEEFSSDPELADAYYSALDQGLEPRKARGRDAALVGLRAFSDVGILKDARVDQARALLSQLFNGRRIDALDALLLPVLPKPDLLDAEQRLAAKLPTFYVEFVLGSVDPSNTTLLRALLERGVPASWQSKLERSVLSVESRQLYARALFERGRTYWRTSDFIVARAMATTRQPMTEENSLIAALSQSLEQGPKDAAAMMLGSTQLNTLGELTALESLSKGKSPIAALAAYDAAAIRQLGSSADSSADFFLDLAARYQHAATRLKDPAQRQLANERALAAMDTAKKLH